MNNEAKRASVIINKFRNISFIVIMVSVIISLASTLLFKLVPDLPSGFSGLTFVMLSILPAALLEIYWLRKFENFFKQNK